MKLVLTYYTGGYEGCNVTIPFEYESKVKAICDLYEEWNRVGREQLREEEYVKKNHPKPNNKKEKWNSYWEWMPKVNTHIKLGTIPDLSTNDFTSWEGEHKEKRVYDKPSILTLDEWFEKNKE